MEDRAKPEDFRLLGISPDAGAEELDRAYHRARAIYSEGSLATYSMMDETERAAMRERIEEANMRIGAGIARLREASFNAADAAPAEAPFAPAAVPSVAPAAAPREAAAPAPESLDWESPPGPQLRRIREGRGITLQQIAAATRVRAIHFSNIEEEKVSELPSTVYLRGFLLEYARFIRLPDPEGAVVRYLAWAAQHSPQKE
jgi:hypothetical protein